MLSTVNIEWFKSAVKTNTTSESRCMYVSVCVLLGIEEKESTFLTHFIVSEKKQVAPHDPSPSYLETHTHACMATHTEYTQAPTMHPFQQSKY